MDRELYLYQFGLPMTVALMVLFMGRELDYPLCKLSGKEFVRTWGLHEADFNCLPLTPCLRDFIYVRVLWAKWCRDGTRVSKPSRCKPPAAFRITIANRAEVHP